MVDYLLVKRNNDIFVVVYQGTVRPCRDCSWCKKYKLPGTHVAELKLCEVSVSLFLAIHFYQKLIRGWNVQLSFNAREYSHLPYLETLVTDVHFQQMAAARSSCRCFKTRVLHFSVKNAPLKDKKWKEKVQKKYSAFFLWSKGSFSSRNRPSRNSALFSSRRSAWSVLKCNQGSEVSAVFSGTFCTLWPRKLRFWKEIYVFLNVS